MLILVRHAHTDWTPDEMRPLSDRGRADAFRVAAALADLPIHAIYSSPYTRARQTVEPLSTARGLPIVTIDDLRERHLGQPPWTEVPATGTQSPPSRTDRIRYGHRKSAARAGGLGDGQLGLQSTVMRTALPSARKPVKHVGPQHVLSSCGDLGALVPALVDEEEAHSRRVRTDCDRLRDACAVAVGIVDEVGRAALVLRVQVDQERQAAVVAGGQGDAAVAMSPEPLARIIPVKAEALAEADDRAAVESDRKSVV